LLVKIITLVLVCSLFVSEYMQDTLIALFNWLV